MIRFAVAILFCALLCSCDRPVLTDCAVTDKLHRSGYTQFIRHTSGESHWTQQVRHPPRWWIYVSGCPTNGPDAGVYETRSVDLERKQWAAVEIGQRWNDVP